MTANPPAPLSQSRVPFYRDERVLKILAQIISTVLVITFFVWAVINFLQASDDRGLSLSYDFLKQPAGFPISDPGIEYNPSMPYLRAFQVGLVNTLRVAVGGIIVATILGTLVALARLSPNWLLSKIALVYIEFHRNIPLLVLLFLWYSSVFTKFPEVAAARDIKGLVFFSNRGVFLTWPRISQTGDIFLAFSLAGIVLSIVVFAILRRRRATTGKETFYTPISLAILFGFPLIGWILSGGSPIWFDIPLKGKFNFSGGKTITPEFAGLFIGLVMYTAAFMAEVVRAGIQSVKKGQTEAARAVGLANPQVLSLVVLPQALRVIIPPMISQYLNLTKNTSLALAIGYQDVFMVGKTTVNQAGRAVPAFSIVMLIYLTLSLLTSAILNLYNRRIQFVTR